MLFFLFLGCNSETTTKTFNDNPSVTITSHDATIDVLEGQEEVFRARVSDTNDALSELQIAWYLDEDIVCDWSNPDPAGESLCSVVIAEDSQKVVAEVRDPQSAAARAEVQINVKPSYVPIIQLLSPSLGEVYYQDQLIRFAAEISDDEDEPSDLVVEWESSLDGVLALSGEADSSGSLEDFGYLSEGEHAVSLSVTDSSGKDTTSSVVIMVGGPNSTPTCSITSPESSSAGVAGDTVIFEANVGDDNINANELLVQWSSDKDGDFGTVTPSSNGSVGLAYDGLSENTHTVTLTVTDEVGASCTDYIFYTVGTPPEVIFDQPMNGDVYSTSDNILFVANISDNEDQPNEVSLSWVSDIDGEISTQSATSAGVAQFSASNLSAGYHNLIVHATDSDGLTADSVVGFRVNTPPDIPQVSITPQNAYTTDTLSVSLMQSGDQDGDTVTHSYLWYKNGVATNLTTSNVSASDTQKEDIWMVEVTPNDGYQDGPFAQASITIDNTEPIVSSGLISPSLPFNDDVLNCSANVYDPDETPAESYLWEDMSSGSILGTGTTLDLGTINIEPSGVIRCTITATDSSNAVNSSSVSISVQNREPIISAVSISPSSPATSDTLLCSGSFSEPDGEGASEHYVWENSTTNTPLGTGVHLVLDPSQVTVSDVITCTFSVTDDSGATASLVSSVTVQNTAPFITEVDINPESPINTDTLLCSVTAEEPDNESITETFSWYNDTTGASLGSGGSLVLDPSIAVAGDEIRCVAEVVDIHGGSDTLFSLVTVISTAPQFTQEAMIYPNTGVRISDTLTCSGTAIDFDGSIPTLTYSWINDTTGTIIGTNDGLSLSLSIAQPTDTISCTITATDIDGETATSSASIVIENSLPEIDSLSLSPQTAYTDDDIVASVLASDADGETISIVYEWSVDGIVQTSTSDTLASSNFVKGQTVTLSVTPFDTQGAGIAFGASVVIQNSPPEAPTVSVDPVAAFDTDDIVCSIDTPSADIDGDTVTYSYAWLVDGNSTVHTSDVLSASDTNSGEVWTCLVTPNDGSEDGAFASAQTDSINGDSDGDGVLDPDDVCPGYDDNLDSNGNSVPDGCESSLTFSYTSSPQSFIVPTNVTSISIECYGAQGWSGNNAGGEGGYTFGTLDVEEGEEFWLYVGGQGTVATGAGNPMGSGWNGGGEGQNNSSGNNVGGGGGASDVRTVYSSNPLDSTSLLSRLIVAGGGGGATNNTGARGGHGGGSVGQDGGQHSSNHYGRGGTQTTGGSSGGDFGYGGSGTNSMTPWNGGGGGGWYGGGTSTAHSGGGGGSSYIGGVLNGTMTQGSQSGNGQIIISYALP
ncbi:MAG: hypothetical protein CL916_07985 [Deltaproteobacteria bacterium]|nr:hypothetical protein [Deltaproteobacteria bacterium]